MLDRDTIVGPLQASVQRRLDDLVRSVGDASEERAAELGKRQVPLLVETLRSVLALHEPDARGRCPICRPRGSRLLFWRRNRTPCRAYLAVQLRLEGLDEPTAVIPTVTSHQRRRKPHLNYAG
ncbi:hypothetical protein [Amycolatopsis cihanbeyliensis]|uniref:Uncharacterized protein n=1 Tax=Amycolatopsis cihanbeyliensis TaxID=1128664 RepID=A0A542DDR1_AMYCI|nr:hypothetical protein [Amycolatopsis cihanbeyliensis]TQJ01202.1 hypothetical protein FB471_0867 [Amycolatopsis cihanbeyliensis]